MQCSQSDHHQSRAEQITTRVRTRSLLKMAEKREGFDGQGDERDVIDGDKLEVVGWKLKGVEWKRVQ
ncbi:hypothetical protein GE21DRAFT_3690 [Neurospora crassa]|uniref:Uncharacterized protein n=1 Tax=Neurospora crassa (strain ATCC 24698 / 74-OR23-1A / CBS 708.71 / DSM 1257 / FGSC 987) TaxID=367110 RepID=Q7S2N7_NEUCR|nr:hypothetical protein NCU09351 [Neurospora crassa OR74A]EAA29694.1 hypothetical protein NCU09351 [Neurospora crassa OR74A]KHE87254.1 hypothetical protein GE21DRAFT_3690 [Neurospora crassa]|eukprot:XP_958930.1 hypothetical protein NCU09351 [Neurospora crassa OR74A]